MDFQQFGGHKVRVYKHQTTVGSLAISIACAGNSTPGTYHLTRLALSLCFRRMCYERHQLGTNAFQFVRLMITARAGRIDIGKTLIMSSGSKRYTMME